MLEVVFLIGAVGCVVSKNAMARTIAIFTVITSSMTHKLMYPEAHTELIGPMPIWASTFFMGICLGYMYHLVIKQRKE